MVISGLVCIPDCQMPHEIQILLSEVYTVRYCQGCQKMDHKKLFPDPEMFAVPCTLWTVSWRSKSLSDILDTDHAFRRTDPVILSLTYF